ncbi:tail fiber assembly protein [Cronobacter sakazakii]|uniref:tail fiber assembly protein n=1 Tax=Cronobacter sakazakii TaxID=28141 RepID=UPI000DA23853|nr:tail fiber assembly protein [Cronobacter sakazakii]MCZ6108387.1 tail fiber assembly protein [Cronobacter sakazakii]MCZ6113185.1 tail fiber assembly protein [Cronobacter sakazakii]MCZ6130153.1 tail fiber assembly protein [Cronobacter sakazakii]MCZ6137409.1 tail fiber assembly protein [Cronobacter sakazakii]MCZ6425279.1 tail fiber assembly protein [Cronobacter sakazakii]
MSDFFFSASEKTFFIKATLPLYENAGTLPADVIEIDNNVAREFMADARPGKVIGVDESGMPVWIDAPPPSQEEVILSNTIKKQVYINQANDYINNKQWPGKAAMGRLTNMERNSYNQWLDYLDALEAIDNTSSQNIAWPESPQN